MLAELESEGEDREERPNVDPSCWKESFRGTSWMYRGGKENLSVPMPPRVSQLMRRKVIALASYSTGAGLPPVATARRLSA